MDPRLKALGWDPGQVPPQVGEFTPRVLSTSYKPREPAADEERRV